MFGIHSAMPSTQAQRLCPHAVFVAGDHEHYGEISERVMAIFTSFTPLVEAISLDEAFLDVTGRPAAPRRRPHHRRQDPGRRARAGGASPARWAWPRRSSWPSWRPRRPSRASAARGPEPGLGVKVVDAGEVLAFLHPLPVQALWGVGPKTLEKLHRLGVDTVADLAAPRRAVGRRRRSAPPTAPTSGSWPWASTTATSIPHQRAKSIGHEETFAHDHHSLDIAPARSSCGSATRWPQRLRAAGMAGAHGHHQGAVPRLPHHHPLDHAAVGRRHRPRRGAGRHRAAPARSTPRPGCGCSAST